MKLDTLLIWIGIGLILLVGIIGPTPKAPELQSSFKMDCTLLGDEL